MPLTITNRMSSDEFENRYLDGFEQKIVSSTNPVLVAARQKPSDPLLIKPIYQTTTMLIDKLHSSSDPVTLYEPQDPDHGEPGRVHIMLQGEYDRYNKVVIAPLHPTAGEFVANYNDLPLYFKFRQRAAQVYMTAVYRRQENKLLVYDNNGYLETNKHSVFFNRKPNVIINFDGFFIL